MKCEEFKNLISSYIEGDCLQKQEFERHMAQCAACRTEFEETKKIVTLCQNMPQMPLPEGFEQRLHERLVLEAKPKKSVMFHLKEYKRGFVVGAAVVAASLVFVATPFFHLYNDSGDVSHPTIQDNPIVGMLPKGSQAPEGTAEPDPAAEPGIVPETGAVLPGQTQNPSMPESSGAPANISGQDGTPQGGSPAQVQQPSGNPQPAGKPNSGTEVRQPEQQPQQPASGGTEPQKVQQPDNTVREPENQPVPTLGGENAGDQVSSGGGGGSAVRGTMTTGLEDEELKVEQISANAGNRAWLQENTAGYGSRQTIDGVEVVILTQAEYQALVDSDIACETPRDVPQAVKDLMSQGGYYVILK